MTMQEYEKWKEERREKAVRRSPMRKRRMIETTSDIPLQSLLTSYQRPNQRYQQYHLLLPDATSRRKMKRKKKRTSSRNDREWRRR